MEILRIPSNQVVYEPAGLEPNAEYPFTILDTADSSVSTGTTTTSQEGLGYIILPNNFDGEYEVTIDGSTEIITVVRPYVDPTTMADTATEIAEYAANEEIARAIIDSIIREGFYYKKYVLETTGLGADYIAVWKDAKEIFKVYENNVLVFDSVEPTEYELNYELTKDKTAITVSYDKQFNRSESAPNILPAAMSDLLDLDFKYRGFSKTFDYSIHLGVGYKKIPSDIVRATKLLIEDLACGKLDYYKRYISDYNTDQFKLSFDDRVFEGTGNIIVDKILSKYAKSITTVGVL
jgi:hypothetical protein